MDRPLFLERALLSIAHQSFRDYVHVVVNDGGDNEAVKAAIKRTHCDHARVRLVDAVKNRGMEAASNLAIRNSRSKFIVIHDDDDSWEPEFLHKTVAFLEGAEGSRYGGVITHSTYCSEEVTAEGIVVRARAPYKSWVENVHLMEMAIGNFFPPIAFLFRREIWERLGGYNEHYPVLGDWDFNLRFLIEADIGVIPEALANYHHRDRGDGTAFGNSVIAGRDKHVEFAAVVRNNLLRSLARRGHSAAATLVGVGLYLEDQRNLLRASDDRLAQLGKETVDLRLRMGSLGSSLWADRYWLAFLKLLRAVSDNDVASLNRIASLVQQAKSPMMRLLSRPRGDALGRHDAKGRDGVEHAAVELLKEVINPQSLATFILIPPDFDEAAYLRQNPDVEVCVKRGDFASGYEHYVKYGRDEGRLRPSR
jgi:glycosyltransferase involved in cell wall biosynthesis